LDKKPNKPGKQENSLTGDEIGQQKSIPYGMLLVAVILIIRLTL